MRLFGAKGSLIGSLPYYNYMVVFREKKGFTLIELLVVISVIAVLSGFMVVNFSDARKKAKDTQRKADLRQIQAALELIRADHNCYPFTGSCNFTWSCGGPLTIGANTYMKKIPCDPAGTSYYNNGVYGLTANGTSYILSACLENANDMGPDTTNIAQPHSDPAGVGRCPSGRFYEVRSQ